MFVIKIKSFRSSNLKIQIKDCPVAAQMGKLKICKDIQSILKAHEKDIKKKKVNGYGPLKS
jgi:hypothetical protein